MRTSAEVIRELIRERSDLRVVYGVATGVNTVQIAGAATAVELPALSPVVNGDYVAILVSGADRLILGRVGGETIEWTPTVTQSNTLSITANLSRYSVHGEWVMGRFQFTINSTGTAGNPLKISMPVTPDVLLGNVGTGGIYDDSTAVAYRGTIDCAAGNWFVLSDTTQASGAWWLGTVTFTAALVAGDSVGGHFFYRRAVT